MYTLNLISVNEKDAEKTKHSTLSCDSDLVAIKTRLESGVEKYICDLIGRNNYVPTLELNIPRRKVFKHVLLGKTNGYSTYAALYIESDDDIRRIHVYSVTESGWVRSLPIHKLVAIFTITNAKESIERIEPRRIAVKPNKDTPDLVKSLSAFNMKTLKPTVINGHKRASSDSELPFADARRSLRTKYDSDAEYEDDVEYVDIEAGQGVTNQVLDDLINRARLLNEGEILKKKNV